VFGELLQESVDQGMTWANRDYVPVLDRSDETSPFGYPRTLVGGQGTLPTRWYLAVNRDFRLGGSTVLRSDDDTHNWNSVLAYRGGAADVQRATPGTPNIQIGAVAHDPANPDHVFVARMTSPPYEPRTTSLPPPDSSGITESRDGGATWSDLGSQHLGLITGLVLSPDSMHLFVASDQGVRLMSVAP